MRGYSIADRLGWFGDRTDIEEILQRGEEVRRMISDGESEELHIEEARESVACVTPLQ